MSLDEKVCLCFGVSRRKVINFIRVEKPSRAGQLSECFGAGTGCGWCRRFLEEIFENCSKCDDRKQALESMQSLDLPKADQYAEMRKDYLKKTGRQPPAGNSSDD